MKFYYSVSIFFKTLIKLPIHNSLKHVGIAYLMTSSLTLSVIYFVPLFIVSLLQNLKEINKCTIIMSLGTEMKNSKNYIVKCMFGNKISNPSILFKIH